MPLESGFNKIIKKIQEDNQCQNDINDNGFIGALHIHKQAVHNLGKNLEGIPFKNEKFNKDEINRVLEINKTLKEYKKINSQAPELLSEVVSYLDGIDIWKSKFTTGDIGKNRFDDSIYYITKDNISLRLKRSELQKGLKYVIQSFMENIVFAQDQFNPSEIPIIGSIPSEYCSDEFYRLQSQSNTNEDFVSNVSKYYKNECLFFVGKPKNLYHEHGGDLVNKIYYIK